MIDFLSSWAEQIVLAVIVATIIELILPNNKNKKYIHMVIGVYVLFNIISPIIKNKDVFAFDEYIIENEKIISSSATTDSSLDKKLEKIYFDEFEKDITSRFEENGCVVLNCKIDAELDTSKKDAGIHSITIEVSSPVDEDVLNDIKKDIAKDYEISKNQVTINISN